MISTWASLRHLPARIDSTPNGPFAESPGHQESYLSCEDGLVSGSATKTAAASDWSSNTDSTEELDRAAKYFVDMVTKYGSSSTSIDDTLTMHSGSPDAERGEPAYEGQNTGSAAETGLDSGSELPPTAVVDAFKLWDKNPADCAVTCNGGSLPLRGWWPCRYSFRLPRQDCSIMGVLLQIKAQ